MEALDFCLRKEWETDMSEPVTNAEVEDVLSSIRRLVSEDKRPLQAPRAAPPPNDKLVLTPALRVAEPAGPGPDSEPEAIQPSAPPASQFDAGGQVDDWSDDDDQDAAQQDFETTEYRDADDDYDDYHDEAPEHADSGDDALEFAEEGADVESEPLVLEDALETPRNTLYPRLDDDEDDTTPESDTHVSARAGFKDTEDDGDTDEPDVMFSHRFAAAPRTKGVAPRAGTLSEKIAALETAIGNSREEWEPESAGSGDYAGTRAPAMAWEDDDGQSARRPQPRAEQSARSMDSGSASPFARPSAQEEAVAPPPEENADNLSDDQVLDEEALRDLVAEIVRAELQGALGERITRNVRKLVRREIHRALTAQELE